MKCPHCDGEIDELVLFGLHPTLIFVGLPPEEIVALAKLAEEAELDCASTLRSVSPRSLQ